MSKTNDKKKVRNALRRGKRSAKTADTLQMETGIKKSRTQEPLREIIRELIAEGLPVGSLSACGYWIIADKSELKEVINSLKSRTRGINSRIKEIRLAFESYYK